MTGATTEQVRGEAPGGARFQRRFPAAGGSPSLAARVLLAMISLYQSTSALRQPRCRFLPTCSAYTVEAITVHGARRGILLAVRRIGRCHPWSEGRVDPVPDEAGNLTVGTYEQQARS